MACFLKKETIYLCPEVNGTLTFEGKPLANHPIRIAIVYGGKIPLNEFVYTDELGNFHFEGYQVSRLPKILFEPPRIAQQILTTINNKEYRLWEAQLPESGISDIEMVNSQLINIKVHLNEDMTNISYYYECPESPNSYLLVKSVLELNGMTK